MEITEKKYWENYYKNSGTDAALINLIASPYNKYWDLLVNKCVQPENIIEIGAYPGRYLSYLAHRYNLLPIAFDYNSDIEAIKKSFHSMGVLQFKIVNSNFLDYETYEKFDIVYSLGFIEHFSNYDQILDKHVAWLKPGGTMLIMVPNKRYLRYIYDLLLDHNNLRMHNLKCMKKIVFNNFIKRNNLELIELEYFKGFDYTVHDKLNTLQKILYFTARRLFKFINPFLEKFPSRFHSSSLICIVKKPL